MRERSDAAVNRRDDRPQYRVIDCAQIARGALTMNDELEVYHWLGSLGFPDLARCPTVRVATGAWSVHTPGAPQKTFLQGFLVADDGQRFEVFLPDELTTRSFRRTDATATLLEAVYHKPGDLREDRSEERR